MSETTAITVPEAKEIRAQADDWVGRAKAITITESWEFEATGAMLTGIKALRSEINSTFDDSISQAHKLHKGLVAKKKEYEAPLTEAERIIKGKMAAYHSEQERKAREEQRRLEAEARKAEEERRLAEAAELEAQGLSEEADAVISEPITSYVPPPAPAPKADGVSFRENWKAEVTDKAQLLKFVLDHYDHFSHVIEVSMPALNSIARVQRSAMQIPGTRAVCEKSVAARSS